jgi:hypothetical protein
LTASGRWRRYNIPLEVLRKQVERLEPPEDCCADEKLAAAVSVALVLGKPLLVADESGTGEAELGPLVTMALGLGEPDSPARRAWTSGSSTQMRKRWFWTASSR